MKLLLKNLSIFLVDIILVNIIKLTIDPTKLIIEKLTECICTNNLYFAFVNKSYRISSTINSNLEVLSIFYTQM